MLQDHRAFQVWMDSEEQRDQRGTKEIQVKRESRDGTGSVYLALQDHLDPLDPSSTSRIFCLTTQTEPLTSQGFLKLREPLGHGVQRGTLGCQESKDLQD